VNSLVKYAILFLLIFNGTNLFAQKYSTKSKKAIKHFEEGDKLFYGMRLDDAEAAFNKALEADDGFWEARIMLGDVYEKKGDISNAIKAYNQVNTTTPKAYANALKIQAEWELSLGRYKDAIKHLDAFLAKEGIDPRMEKVSSKLLQSAQYAAEAIKDSVPFNPINLGPTVNTSDYEYFPSLTVDGQTLIFTRNTRTGPVAGQEDFYITKLKDGKWLPAMNLGPPVNTNDNEGAQAISVDGQHLFFTGCNRKAGMGSCDIYYSKKDGKGWTPAVNIGGPVNSGKWESQPSFSSDGRTLYFSSNRKAGEGQSDIWYSKLKPDGTWTVPTNLGSVVNTSGHEESPFIHPDGHTLYFTSDGHLGFGEKDIFVTRLQPNGEWSTPLNLGYPINTWKDEIGIIVNATGELAYFSSSRDGGEGKLDIFSFELYDKVRPIPVTYMKGVVKNAVNGRALSAQFELIDLATSEVVARSNSDGKDGSFLVCLPVNKDYGLNVSKDGFLFHSEHFALKDTANATSPFIKNVQLQPINYGSSVVLKNIFFETNSFKLMPASNAELDKLVAFLSLNKEMRIELGGHTDNIGGTESNQALSENRAAAVYQYLVDHAIHPSRLEYVGYGESSPVADNGTDEGRSLNRRTEFKVLEQK
jgi:outer membrane protein OmpA-like peptidoglycan-associated protein/Tol biopolymer transport system component